MRLARIRRARKVFEKRLLARETLQIEAQTEAGFDARVDPAILECLVLAHEPASRFFERAEERGMIEMVLLLDVVGLAQDLRRRALHRVAELAHRRFDDRRDGALALGRRQLAGKFDGHPAADHDEAKAEAELPLDLDFDHIRADELPPESPWRLVCGGRAPCRPRSSRFA